MWLATALETIESGTPRQGPVETWRCILRRTLIRLDAIVAVELRGASPVGHTLLVMRRNADSTLKQCQPGSPSGNRGWSKGRSSAAPSTIVAIFVTDFVANTFAVVGKLRVLPLNIVHRLTKDSHGSRTKIER